MTDRFAELERRLLLDPEDESVRQAFLIELMRQNTGDRRFHLENNEFYLKREVYSTRHHQVVRQEFGVINGPVIEHSLTGPTKIDTVKRLADHLSWIDPDVDLQQYIVHSQLASKIMEYRNKNRDQVPGPRLALIKNDKPPEALKPASNQIPDFVDVELAHRLFEQWRNSGEDHSL